MWKRISSKNEKEVEDEEDDTKKPQTTKQLNSSSVLDAILLFLSVSVHKISPLLPSFLYSLTKKKKKNTQKSQLLYAQVEIVFRESSSLKSSSIPRFYNTTTSY